MLVLEQDITDRPELRLPVIHIVRYLREPCVPSTDNDSGHRANEPQEPSVTLPPPLNTVPEVEQASIHDSHCNDLPPAYPEQPDIGDLRPELEETFGVFYPSSDHLPLQVSEQAALLPCVTALDHIQANGLEEFCDPVHFSLMWENILNHFFPTSEGFTVAQNWFNPTDSGLYQSGDSETASICFTCFHRPRSGLYRLESFLSDERGPPIAVIRIFSPLDYHNRHLRDAAQQYVENQLNSFSPFSDYTNVLAISAMGKAWRGWTKDISYLPWTEDVTSDSSWDMLHVLVDNIKVQTQTGEYSFAPGKQLVERARSRNLTSSSKSSISQKLGRRFSAGRIVLNKILQ